MGEFQRIRMVKYAAYTYVVSDLLDQYGVRLNVLGKREMLPPSVRAAIKKAEDMTAKNDRCATNT